jgi:EAL and modified HD-GYP domain-containing signal transduction protein
MSDQAENPIPTVGLEAVANAQHEWVAAAFRPDPASAVPDCLLPLFAHPDTDAALAGLDRIVPLPEPLRFDLARHGGAFATASTVLCVSAAALADEAVRKHCAALSGRGYRLLVDGEAGLPAQEAGCRGVAHGGPGLPTALSLMSLPGPHWAYGVDEPARFETCKNAGMAWFSGAYAVQRAAADGDGTSRQRLLSLLALLARDADSRELETVLKQDPALSYHLLKIVNSAAFGRAQPIHHFGQAINVLGRRQLQRWLQLLLNARPQQDGPGNPLLPQAALRAAQMEALVKLQGGDRDRQDLAFVAGVFALLDALLGMPMPEIVAALSLDLDVVSALLDRTGPLGELLALVEQPRPDAGRLAAVGLTPAQFWDSQLQGWRWAVQVSGNL